MKKVVLIAYGIVYLCAACLLAGCGGGNPTPSEIKVIIESPRPTESAGVRATGSKSMESGKPSSSQSSSSQPSGSQPSGSQSSGSQPSGSESGSSQPSGSQPSGSQSGGSSQSPQASGGQKTVEPQQLISKEEAEALLGETVKGGETKEQPALGIKTVVYSPEKQDSKGFIKVSIIEKSALSSKGADKPDGVFQAVNGALGDPKSSESGIGDQAFETAPALHIMAGEYYISIAAGGEDPQKAKEVLKTAGRLAVNNMKKLQGQ
jgi:hypothetical protein